MVIELKTSYQRSIILIATSSFILQHPQTILPGLPFVLQLLEHQLTMLAHGYHYRYRCFIIWRSFSRGTRKHRGCLKNCLVLLYSLSSPTKVSAVTSNHGGTSITLCKIFWGDKI